MTSEKDLEWARMFLAAHRTSGTIENDAQCLAERLSVRQAVAHEVVSQAPTLRPESPYGRASQLADECQKLADQLREADAVRGRLERELAAKGRK